MERRRCEGSGHPPERAATEVGICFVCHCVVELTEHGAARVHIREVE